MKKEKIILIVNILLVIIIVVTCFFVVKEYGRLQEIKELKRITYEFDDRQKECEIIGLSNKYVYVTRKNENDEPMVGAKWKVTDKDGIEVGIIEINENGNGGLIGLENGEYYAEEIEVPEGYTIKNTKYNFFVSESDTSFTIYESDVKHKNVLIIRVTDKDGNPVQGIKYSVYSKNKEFIKEITTNAEGLAGVQYIPEGLYYYKQSDEDNSKMQTIYLANDEVAKKEIIYESKEAK